MPAEPADSAEQPANRPSLPYAQTSTRRQNLANAVQDPLRMLR
jgi:hypothetical protein